LTTCAPGPSQKLSLIDACLDVAQLPLERDLRVRSPTLVQCLLGPYGDVRNVELIDVHRSGHQLYGFVPGPLLDLGARPEPCRIPAVVVAPGKPVVVNELRHA